MARIAVLGAGVMGTALTYPLTDNGHQINLIGTHLDDAIIAGCKAEGVHPRLGRALPPRVRPFAFSEAPPAIAGPDVVALGVNSRGVRWAGRVLAEHLVPGQRVVMVTKGLAAGELGDLQIFPDLLAEQLPEHLRARVPIAAIGGPSIAGELAA